MASKKILTEWLEFQQANKEIGTISENKNNTWALELTYLIHEKSESQTRISPEAMQLVGGNKNPKRVQKPKEVQTAPSVCSSPFVLVVLWDWDPGPGLSIGRPLRLNSYALFSLLLNHSQNSKTPPFIHSPPSSLDPLSYVRPFHLSLHLLYWAIWNSQSVLTFSEWFFHLLSLIETLFFLKAGSKVCLFLP